MTSESTAIKVAYETLGMSPEEIAEDRGLQVVSVKAALMAASKDYRQACGKEENEEDKLNFTKEDTIDVLEVIRQTAKYAEDPHLRFKAAVYIRDDHKGRLEPAKVLGGDQFNIFQFNESMQKIRQLKEKTLKTINV